MKFSTHTESQLQEGFNFRNRQNRYNIHPCPSCGFMTLMGMPGGRDAVCKNCGFKEPCCSD